MDGVVTFDVLAWVAAAIVGFVVLIGGWAVNRLFGKIDAIQDRFDAIGAMVDAKVNDLEKKLGRKIAAVEGEDRRTSGDNAKAVGDVARQLAAHQLHVSQHYASIAYLKDVEGRLTGALRELKDQMTDGFREMKTEIRQGRGAAD